MFSSIENCKSVDEISRVMRSSIPLPLADDLLEELVTDARDFALLHGAGMRYKDSYSATTLSMAPFFLLPSPFPRRDFEKVYNLQPLVNKLMYKVANNHEFLEKCLKKTIEADDFTKRLWEIYMAVRKEGVVQPCSLILLRFDAMLDTTVVKSSLKHETCVDVVEAQSRNDGPKSSNNNSEDICCYGINQVEVNTIASSFAAFSTKLRDIQRYVLNKIGRQDLVEKLPENDALEGLCSAMIAAFDLYDRSKAVIVFVIEDTTYNICDQRCHEYEVMRQRPDITVLRKSLTQLHKEGTMDAERRFWLGEREVAVLYYRSGYDPSFYHGEEEWGVRLLLERSRAIKCPSVEYHLAGTKKIQQELSGKGVLLQFLEPEEAKQVAQIFTGLYTLDMGPEGDETVRMAMEDPERFVLKPQREGGGNNVYGEEIRETLSRIGSSSLREAYILMDRIRAPIQRNYLLRPQGEGAELKDTISELGIFGALLSTPDKIFLNTACGHTLRSKVASNNEGGISSGNGALDSVLLVD